MLGGLLGVTYAAPQQQGAAPGEPRATVGHTPNAEANLTPESMANRRPRAALSSGVDLQTGDRALDGQRMRAQMMLRRQRYRRVLAESRTGLQDFPTDPALHQMQAIALAEYGDYWGAAESFELAMGSEYAILLALVAEADTLRVVGAPGEAEAVRSELIASGVSSNRELVMLSRLYEDYRAHGDLEGMWDVAHRALAFDPTAGLAHAMMALYYTEVGNEAAAGAALWTAHQYGGLAVLVIIAEIEFPLAFGRPVVAAEVSSERREKVLKSKAYMATRGRALLAADDVDTAVEMCDLTVWKMSGELWEPELLAVQAVTYARMGWFDESLVIAGRLEQSYAHLDRVEHALQEVAALAAAADAP